MNRLTPKREKEIRESAETCCDSLDHACNIGLELLAEIDVLRKERDTYHDDFLSTARRECKLESRVKKLRAALLYCTEDLATRALAQDEKDSK